MVEVGVGRKRGARAREAKICWLVIPAFVRRAWSLGLLLSPEAREGGSGEKRKAEIGVMKEKSGLIFEVVKPKEGSGVSTRGLTGLTGRVKVGSGLREVVQPPPPLLGDVVCCTGGGGGGGGGGGLLSVPELSVGGV